MLENGFDLATAATHDNCPSAQYFLKKLAAIAPTTPGKEAAPTGALLQ
jgi:hypothetical protein